MSAPAVSLSDVTSRYGLSDDTLNRECSREHLLEISRTIDWREVGKELVDDIMLQDIECEANSEALRRHKLLERWKQRRGFMATYRVLVEAMLRAGRVEEAGRVCGLLSPDGVATIAAGSNNSSDPHSKTTLPRKDQTPRLPELIQFKTGSNRPFNILERIGTSYHDFGIILLDDDTGALIEAIVHEKREKASDINRDIITKWLSGRGREPKTWSVLVEALEAVNLLELVKDIHEGL